MNARQRRHRLALATSLVLGASAAALWWFPAPSAPAFGGALTVRSFDVVTSGDHLQTLVLGQFKPDAPTRLAYVEAREGGKYWKLPHFIDTAGAEPISSRGNDVQLATSGRRRVAVFQVKGEFPGNGPLMVAVSEDGGTHWQSGILPVSGDPQRNQAYPDVEIDADGTIHLVWLDDRDENGSSQGLRAAISRDGGQSWQSESTVDTDVCTCCSTRLSRLPDATLALLYRDHTPKDMRLAKNSAAEDRWQTTQTVGAFNWTVDACPHSTSGITSVRDGDTVIMHAAIWTGEANQTGVHYLRSDPAGSAWPTQLLIDRTGDDPDIASGLAGQLAIVYRQGHGNQSRIAWVASSDGGAHWSAPQLLSPVGQRVDHPRVVSTPDGFRVFWTERTGDKTKRLASVLHDISS